MTQTETQNGMELASIQAHLLTYFMVQSPS